MTPATVMIFHDVRGASAVYLYSAHHYYGTAQVLKDSFQRKKEAGEQKAKETEQSTGTFKIVGTRDSKILDWSSKHVSIF